MGSLRRAVLGFLAAGGLGLAGGGPPAGAAAAQPLDLSDPTPRWVEVSFESSPAELPGQLAAVWTPRYPARLRPGLRDGWVTVAVPPEVVEKVLLRRVDPEPGSFGPFVWVFDAASGHVITAEFAGAVNRKLDLGLLHPRVRAEIRASMDTLRPAGFRPARRLLGQVVFEHCRPGPDDRDCRAVLPTPLDPVTGYVNAVGMVQARGFGYTTRSFSCLGEARFFERGPELRLASGELAPAPAYPLP